MRSLPWRDRLGIGPLAIGKAQRLLEWAPGRGISPQNVLAFGDNENDAAMLVACHGAPMAGAAAQAKEAARKIVGDNNSGVIAETIAIGLAEGAGDVRHCLNSDLLIVSGLRFCSERATTDH